MDSRRSAVNASEGFRRRHAHAAEEWTQRDLNARSKCRDHALLVQRNNLDLAIGKIFRQKSAIGAKYVIGIGNGQLDLLDAYLQGIAGFGFFDINRTVENVSARSFVGDLFINIAQALLYLLRRHSCALQAGRAVGEECVKHYRVARVDMQHRRGRSIVVSPGDSLGSGRQLERLWPAGDCRRLRLCKQESREYRQECEENDLTHVPPKFL